MARKRARSGGDNEQDDQPVSQQQHNEAAGEPRARTQRREDFADIARR